MHLTSTDGFERDVPTYTMVSGEDEEEYSRIEELKNDYDELYYEVEYYKEAIRIECQSFLESSMKKDNKDNTASNCQNISNSSNCHREDPPKKVIPDEIPRKDGPGGE